MVVSERDVRRVTLRAQRRDGLDDTAFVTTAAEMVDGDVVPTAQHLAQVVDVLREGVPDRDELRRTPLVREDSHLVAADRVWPGVRTDGYAFASRHALHRAG